MVYFYINSAIAALMSSDVTRCFRESRWQSLQDLHTWWRADLCRAAFGGFCSLYEAYCLFTFFCAAMGYCCGCCPGIGYWLCVGIGYGLLPAARGGVQDDVAAKKEIGWSKILLGGQTVVAKFANRDGAATFAGLCVGSSVALWAKALGAMQH
mmetsp:Transcript_26906/g.52729  ORF Transcript_26906/g.52729 Transcript_26906/m.52729 type:complete len:153 (+) Transcript_26906:849-1307(+)